MKTNEEKKYLLPKNDIKLFCADDNEYLYYAPRGLIYKINDLYFKQYIDFCLDNNINSLLSPQLIKDIYNYFIQSVSKENTKYAIIKTDETDISGIVLNISGSCNLNCHYCFAKSGKKFSFGNMSADVAVESVDYLINQNPNKNNFLISFFGGEPFLRTGTIEKTINIIENKYPQKKFYYSVTTNGTVMSEKHAELIKRKNMSLLISMDGTEETTNRNRPFAKGSGNTFKTILNSADVLKKYNIPFDFRATATAGQDNILEIIDFFESQKTNYHIVFCFPSYNNKHEYAMWNNKNIEILKIQFNGMIQYYFEKIRNKEFIYASFILEKLKTIATREVTNVACGAGRNMIAVNADGTLYTCMNYSGIKKTSIGNIVNGIDSELNKTYTPQNIDETLCRNCNIRYLCAGACMAERYFYNENITELVEQTCKLQEISWTGYLILFQKIKNLYPKLIDNIANHKLSYENIN
ncbi:MAG: radical SAM protein [Prevotellaceae bacterium]|jgi:uncharacterized protein|nr:radical SAM protein [Prevotellaceae bacterium]